MSVLSLLFDRSRRFASPVMDTYELKVVKLDDGSTLSTYPKVDNNALRELNGKVDNWSLSSLLAAGISPDMPIHTGDINALGGFVAFGNFVRDEFMPNLKSVVESEKAE